MNKRKVRRKILKEIYLDNSATTKVSEEAAKLAYEIMTENYGNPSSLHEKGLNAQLAVEKARKQIADTLNCDENTIFFTSGGTEANNTAILGGTDAAKRRGNKVVTTAFEHSSVIESFKELDKRGFEVCYVSPNEKGEITADALANAVDENTILMSFMLVNNEIGTLIPFEEAVKAIKKKNPRTLIHCDGVQAFGKIPINLKKTDIDLLSISSHKIHGPKGSGALYIKKGVRITPLIHGGEQQRKIRPGTESTPLICAFGLAAQTAHREIMSGESHLKELCTYFDEEVKKREGIVINSPENGTVYIRNISVIGYRSEIMLHALESKGVYVSSGSACAKGEKSHVLKAMGLKNDRIDSALRVSFSKYSTIEEVKVFFEALDKCMQEIIKLK